MTQADKVIKVVIVIMAIVGVIFFSKWYLSQITQINERVQKKKNMIEFYTNGEGCYYSYAESSVKTYQDKVKSYERERSKKLVVLLFGNLGIIVIAIGLSIFLVPNRNDETI